MLQRNLILSAAVGLLTAIGAAGCGSSSSSVQSVSALQPEHAFVGRTIDVVVSGDNTSWTANTTVDFGADITVNKITVASPTALVANVTIAPTAKLGTHDVTVKDGDQKTTYTGGFLLESPIAITTQGDGAQGSLLTVSIRNRDFDNPFDTTSLGGGLFGPPPTFPNIAITSPTGTLLNVTNVAQFQIDATALVDIDAATGAGDINIVSGPMGGTTLAFAGPGALTIVERTATDLPVGMSTNGMVATAFGSKLFKITPGASLSLLDLGISTTTSGGTPALAILPKSGHFADLIAFSAAKTLITKSTDPFFLVVWDNGGTPSYPFTITTSSKTATAAMDTEPNDDTAHAVPLTALPAVIQGASLATTADQDWFVYTAVAADVGKSFHVITLAGDPLTDTLVDAFAADGTTSLGGPSDDGNFHEDFVFPTAIDKPGKFFVQILTSPMFDPTHKNYDAIIELQ